MSTGPARPASRPGRAGQSAQGPRDAEPSPWREAVPELVIAAIAIAAAALAGAAVSGWPGVVTVATGVSVLALVVFRVLTPGSATQSFRIARDKQRARTVSGYNHRRFTIAVSLKSRPQYESELRPVLEHILAARLADSAGVNLYSEPARAEATFCRTRADASLWPWIDPRRARTADRAAPRHGIPRRTLARLITRLEQL